MADTAAVSVRIDAELKNAAEAILAKLGISPSCAIRMLYSQIVLRSGLPFDPCFTTTIPTAIGGMTPGQLEAELRKGIASLADGNGYPAEEVDKMFELAVAADCAAARQ